MDAIEYCNSDDNDHKQKMMRIKDSLKFVVFTLLAFVLIWSACDDQEIKPIGEPYSQVSGIQDSWKLVEVIQVDELTKSRNTELDVSAFYVGSNPAIITFSSSNYQTESGSSRVYFPENGAWQFDNPEFPEKIVLDNGIFEMLAPVRETVDHTLHVKYTRPAADCLPDGVEAVSYVYKFERM